MAFRSELEAARERAEAAEAELASQAERIARVVETEAQLAETQRQLRQEKSHAHRWLTAGLPMVGVGVLLGGLAVGLWARARIGVLTEDARLASARITEVRRAADAEVAAAENEVDSARRDLSLADESLVRVRREVTQIFDDLPSRTGGPLAPLEIAWVTEVEGPAPVSVGASCALVAPSTTETCAADVRCSAEVIHSFGCASTPYTSMEAAGTSARFSHALVGWIVTLGRVTRSVEALSAEIPELAPYLFDPGRLREEIARRHGAAGLP